MLFRYLFSLLYPVLLSVKTLPICGLGISKWLALPTIGIRSLSCLPDSLMVHLFCHFILVEVFTARLTSDMVMTLGTDHSMVFCFVQKFVFGQHES